MTIPVQSGPAGQRPHRLILARRWHRDPVAFAREPLDVDLWDTQQAIARAVRDHPRVACRSCHAAGKTFLAAAVVLWFLYTRPGAQVLTTASTFRQVRYVLWRTIQKLFHGAKSHLQGDLFETELRLGPNWYARGLSTDNSERFQSFHAPHVLVLVDEPGAVPPPVFAAIEGVLASGYTRLLMIGNPTQSSGPFYDAFHNDAAEYRTFRISAFDTPNLREGHTVRPYLVAPDWVDQRRRLWGEDSDLYRSRVLAEFPRAAAGQLFSLALLDAALVDAPPGMSRVALGIDVARFGSDATALSRIEDGVLRHQQLLHGLDTMAVTGHVAAALAQRPDLLLAVDDTGVGGGVTDRLREQGWEPLAVNFGAAASERAYYANRGSEIYARLAAALRDGRLAIDAALPTRDTLFGQLAQVRVEYRSDGRQRVRKRGPADAQPSPDLADSLALAWAAYEEGTQGAGVW